MESMRNLRVRCCKCYNKKHYYFGPSSFMCMTYVQGMFWIVFLNTLISLKNVCFQKTYKSVIDAKNVNQINLVQEETDELQWTWPLSMSL